MKNRTVSQKLTAIDSERTQLNGVAWLGLAMMLIFGVIHFISPPFEYTQSTRKPFFELVGLLVVGTVLSIFAIRIGLRIVHRQKSLLAVIVMMAIGFRIVMAFTPPILELDFYRYLWDGKVSAAGFSPYDYSPQQIKSFNPSKLSASSTGGKLQSIAEVYTESNANQLILDRVHYPDHTTIYPPVSQLVFCASAILTPAQTPIDFHILVLRILLIGFDLGTLLVLVLIFKILKRNFAWLIAYAWNPLVIKEISNSIHLDSIAIFFALLAVWFVIKTRNNNSTASAISGGLALGLGVGAKLFPVVIAPALFFALFKSGWQKGAYFAVAFTVTTLLVLFPMLVRSRSSESVAASAATSVAAVTTSVGAATASPVTSTTISAASAPDIDKSKDGLASFLSTWRINDAIFSTLYHNLKPYSGKDNSYWYVVTSDSFRQNTVDKTGTSLGSDPAFQLTRIITLAIFAVVYLCFVRRFLTGDDHHILAGLLYVVFAFLMLQPTVNPWYWVWAIPFTCFISRWGWVGVSAVLTTYYLRFWFRRADIEFDFLGHSYQDSAIFHHFVAWGEFIAIVVLVIASSKMISASHERNGA